MSKELDLFKSVPSYLTTQGKAAHDLVANVLGGFAALSILGSKFAIVRDGERKLVTRPDEPDAPATSLNIVIVRANPNLSKTYYSKKYEEGTAEAPDCYSNNGIGPEPDSHKPQARVCATCPHNAFGTGLSGKGKACSDSRRLAVAPAGNINDLMLLRVPPTSLKTLRDFGKILIDRGVNYSGVVTKVRFDPSEASPKLLFSPVEFVTLEQHKRIQELQDDDVVLQILGLKPVDETIITDAPESAPAAKPAKHPRASKPVKVELDEMDELLVGKAENTVASVVDEIIADKPVSDSSDLDALLSDYDA